MSHITNSQEFKSKLSEIGLIEEDKSILISLLTIYKNLKDKNFVRELILNYLFS